MRTKILVSLSMFLLSGAAFAECPGNLDTEAMVECITVEGSGANYQDWKKNEYSHNLATTETELAATVSPVTGTDVRTVQPAAGSSTK